MYLTVRNKKKLKTTLTNNPIQPERQIISYNPTHMSSQRVSDAGQPVRSQPGAAQGREGLGRAARHGPQVVDCRHVAGRLG